MTSVYGPPAEAVMVSAAGAPTVTWVVVLFLRPVLSLTARLRV
nr:hypothetical protein [Granulicella tundricola]